ncbi:MAG TPA: murein biosynthesis integral membrane protein MurJ, partial [Cryptosporangiaceae bacterium]|nr:murein biosynthesis integral membrane protein MurJ [Cryptosporangiaceae bacterium]
MTERGEANPTAGTPRPVPVKERGSDELAAEGGATPVVADPDVTQADVAGGEATDAGAASVARNSGIMAAGSVVSRVTGFVRTAAIAAAIGALTVGNAYQVSYALPLQVYELVLGGVLTSVLVPVLVKARKRDPDGGDGYTSRLLSLAVVVLGVTTVLAVLSAPLLTGIFANADTTPEARGLITALSYFMLPSIFFYGLSALLAAVLNTRGHFAAPMWAPIVNNLVVISMALVFLALSTGRLTAATIQPWQVALLGGGTLLGVVSQVAALAPALRRVGYRFRFQLQLRGLGLRQLGRMAGWMFAYVAVSQVGVIVVLRLASLNDTRGGPSALVHNSAFILFMTVHGIVAVSVITALMPRMSAAAVDGKLGEVAAHLSQGARLSAVILVPATAAYLALGVPIAVAVFQWGNLGHDSATAIGYALMAAAIGLVPFAISQMQIFAFYALGDTRTPALANIAVVAVKVVMALALYALLPPAWTIVGLMTANTASYAVAVAVSAWLLRRRVGRLDGPRTAQT